MSMTIKQTNYSQMQIASELLKLLDIDPAHCRRAEITLEVNAPIRVQAEFEVFPLICDEDTGEIKTLMKEFVMVEIEEKDDST